MCITKVKNGGILVFVTSSGTLDKKDESVRQMLADQADLIGAIRLPGGKNGAFHDNAGTDVTTDIIFLQKHDGKSVAEMSDIPDWVHISETADGLPINQYFENPVSPEKLSEICDKFNVEVISLTGGEPLLYKNLKNVLNELIFLLTVLALSF